MKAKIHPTWYADAKVTCACGNQFTTGATVPEIRVEICSACHPFFTGKMKFVDTKGRVQRFQDKQKAAQAVQALKKAKIKKKSGQSPQSLKEMLKKAHRKT